MMEISSRQETLNHRSIFIDQILRDGMVIDSSWRQ